MISIVHDTVNRQELPQARAHDANDYSQSTTAHSVILWCDSFVLHFSVPAI